MNKRKLLAPTALEKKEALPTATKKCKQSKKDEKEWLEMTRLKERESQ